MAASAQQIFDGIKVYIDKQGKPYSAWYAGITTNAETRLFEGHNVPRENGIWAHNECQTNEAARNVEAALLKLGCEGGSGGGDKTSIHVYAYLKSPTTKQ